MFSRVVTAVLLASVLSTVGDAQENGILVGSFHDDYTIRACGPDGRTLFMGSFPLELSAGQSSWNPQHSHWSMLGVSRDGSTISYQLPEGLRPWSAAYDGSDVLILALDFHPQTYRPPDPPPPARYQMLRFDNQANLLNQQRANFDFVPGQIVALPSGKTILLGKYRPASQDGDKNIAAVLDADGKVLNHVAFPLPPQGGGWTIESRMVAGEGAAYLVLFSNDPPATGIAKISEDGSFDVKIIPNPPYNDERQHNRWMAGPGVAVEVYHYVNKRERSTFHFDEYDLNTGDETAYRYAFTSAGGFGCYSREEVSMLVPTAPARGLSPDTLRLVFAKLQDQAVSKPVINPEPCNCEPKAENCPVKADAATAKH
jgi:hypothetical protein